MSDGHQSSLAPTGQIADNVVGFARALRAAGIPVGPGAVIDALNALRVIEIGNRADVFTDAGGDLRQAPRACADLRAGVRPVLSRRRGMEAHAGFGAAAGSRQEEAAAGLAPRPGGDVASPDERDRRRPRSRNSGSRSPTREVLQKKDFAQMSAAEIAAVTRAIAKMKLPQAELRTRRYQPDARGLRLDMRRTLRGSVCAPAAISSISIGWGGSTSRRRSWRCSIFRAR